MPKINQQLHLEDWAGECEAGQKQSPAVKTQSCRGKAKFGEFWGKCAKHELRGMWSSMKSRCENPKDKDFPNYGGRGISVCERWKHFPNFVLDMGPRPKGHTIDRVNNDGNYEKTNCVWATLFEQAQHTRWGRYLEHNGERLTIAQWARKLGVSHELIKLRLLRGWSVEDALTKPADKFPPSRRRKLTDAQVQEIRNSDCGVVALAKRLGVTRHIVGRIRKGTTYKRPKSQ